MFISKKAQLILPSHRLLDGAYEKAKGDKKVKSAKKAKGDKKAAKKGANKSQGLFNK